RPPPSSPLCPYTTLFRSEAGVRASLGDALREAGYHVDTVDSGEACLDQAGRRSYDLILLDIRLPGVDGLTALEWLVARAVDATVDRKSTRLNSSHVKISY